MRAAPPVDAALAAGRAERMLITLLHAMAGFAVAVWAAALAGLTGTVPVAAAALAAAAAMAGLGGRLARQALPGDAGRLRWDGQAWSWVTAAAFPAHSDLPDLPDLPDSPDLPLARLDVAIDLGSWALLRLQPAAGGRSMWRVARARTAGPAWHGLRVALMAHAGELPGPRHTQGGRR